MAIPQSRVIAIINAGLDFMNSFRDLQNLVKRHNLILTQSPDWLDTPDTIKAEWETLANNVIYQHSSTREDAAITLIKEYNWFRVNSKENDRRARRARRKREAVRSAIPQDQTLQEYKFTPEDMNTMLTDPALLQQFADINKAQRELDNKQEKELTKETQSADTPFDGQTLENLTVHDIVASFKKGDNK